MSEAHRSQIEALLKGKQVARYAVKEELPPRGVAKRFRAVQAVLDREVELRVMTLPIPEGSGMSRRFRGVFKALGSCDDSRIYRVLDFGASKGVPFYTLELRDAEPLIDFVEGAGGTLEPEEAVHLGLRLLDVLAEFERNGFPFFGMAPDTLLRLKEDGRICVGDFPAEMIYSRTELEGIGVTPSWAWQHTEWSKGQAVDQRTAIGLLGQTVGYVLTGRRPGETGGDGGYWDGWVRGIPQGLRDWVDRAAHVDRSERFEDLDLTREALDKVRAQQKIKEAVRTSAEVSRLQDIASRSRALRVEDLGLDDETLSRFEKGRGAAARVRGEAAARGARSQRDYLVHPLRRWAERNAGVLGLGLVMSLVALFFFQNLRVNWSARRQISSKEKTLTVTQKTDKLRAAEEELQEFIAAAKVKPTEPATFLRAWTSCREWLILLPPQERKNFMPYSKFVRIFVKFKKRGNEGQLPACKELDRLLLQIDERLEEEKARTGQGS